MNMNNASASSGRQAAAYEETVLKVGLSAWRSCKLFHAVLCEVKTAWWYEPCGEACIVSSERRWHETQWWFCTFEAQWVSMILSALTLCPVHWIVCSHYDSSLYGFWMCVYYGVPSKLSYLEMEGQTGGERYSYIDSNSTGGLKNNSKQRSAGCGSRQLFANITLNSLMGWGLCADGQYVKAKTWINE